MQGAEALERFAAARVARLATVRPDGRPHLVPVVFAFDGSEIVTAIDSKPKRSKDLARLANIRSSPFVSLLVDDYREEWPSLWWVRVDGAARVVDQDPAGTAALTDKYPQYRQDPPPGPVIRIAIEVVSSWSWAAGTHL